MKSRWWIAVSLAVLGFSSGHAKVHAESPPPISPVLTASTSASLVDVVDILPENVVSVSSYFEPAVSFLTRGDFVHISGTDASAHGWWELPGAPPTLVANVTVQLQRKYGTSWINVSTYSGVYPEGGGRGNRTTARALCRGATLTTWRSVVDVDVLGKIDDPGKLYTPDKLLYCAP